MGGCATKPKGSDIFEGLPPTVSSSNKAEKENVRQEDKKEIKNDQNEQESETKVEAEVKESTSGEDAVAGNDPKPSPGISDEAAQVPTSKAPQKAADDQPAETMKPEGG